MSKEKRGQSFPEGKMEEVVSLCKRRGFVFPSSEIYGGFSSTYDYGPYGVELKNNIRKSWWKFFVEDRDDIVGLDGAILMHPKTWEASGHLSDFNDVLVDCRRCRGRFRADQLIAESLNIDMEGKPKEEMTKVIKEKKIKCPVCSQTDFTEARMFNSMFKTFAGVTEDKESVIYLRPETAQAIFLNFKNVLDAARVKIPFGIAQVGKAFRNEITPGNFIFRTREFEQMEIEYFIAPEANWQKIFADWTELIKKWLSFIINDMNKVSLYEHPKEKLSHYSKKTVDIEYQFPFGKEELYGLAYRTNHDLAQHQRWSGADLAYRDPASGAKYLPHVIEPSFGLDRTFLAVLLDAYTEEKLPLKSKTLGGDETRVVMRFKKELAPIKVAVFPLLKNKAELVKKAKEIYNRLKLKFVCEFDDHGNIGKRYRRQDEIGTPFCLTVDFESLKNKDVTVRDRDTMKQVRIKVSKLEDYLREKLG